MNCEKDIFLERSIYLHLNFKEKKKKILKVSY